MSRIAAVLALLVASSVCLAQEGTVTLTPDQFEKIMRDVRDMKPGEYKMFDYIEQNITSAGPGLKVEGADADISKFNASAPIVTLGKDKAGASGGSLSASLSVFGKELNWFMIGGVLCLLGAGFAAYFRLFGAAIAAAGVGGVLIFAAVQPELAGIVIVLGVAACVAYLVWQGKKGKGFHEAARAVVGGVASLPADIQALVKAEIAKQADDKDKAVIKAIKREDGLT